MTETWLQPNRRALWFGCVPPLLLGALSLWLALASWSDRLVWLRWVGIGLMAVAAVVILLLVGQLRRPRVAFRDGHVLFYLRSGQPLAVPAGIVEAFFVGQGPAHLPAKIPHHEASLNLVARLSRRAPQWAERDVKPALGHWSDGYVTIRGTWCEPLNVEVVRRLNRRLKEVQEASDHHAA